MCNANRRTYWYWSVGCAVVLFIFALLAFVGGLVEHRREHTYVRNSCLVKSSHWEKCGISQEEKGPIELCYEPQWLIQFQDETRAETTITGLKVSQKLDYNDNPQLPTLNTYRVSIMRYRKYNAYLKLFFLLFFNRLVTLIHVIILFLIV
jgi:hypothetical protein